MPKSKRYKADILIIGGGAAGLPLACMLGRAGMQVHLVDNHTPPGMDQIKPSGRTVALMNSSWNILKATGLDIRAIQEDYAGPLRAMRIIDDSIPGAEPLENVFEAFDIHQDQYGFNIPNAVLVALLAEKARSLSQVTLHHGQVFSRYVIEGETVCAHLEDGTEITAPLIVGADGRHSAVRRIAGVEMHERDYKQSAMTFLINHSRSHNFTATEFHRPAGPLAFVPLPGNQSSVVWVEDTKQAQTLIKLKKQDFTQKLQDLSRDTLGAITLETGPECWPLKSLRSQSLTAPRMALIAEAAHVLSPITAQGLNLSLRDVASLAETVIDAARAGQDIGTPQTLRTYEKRRMMDIRSRVAGVDGMMRLVSNDVVPVKKLRRTGLRMLDMIRPLKAFAMMQGLAPQVDQGRLARGESL